MVLTRDTNRSPDMILTAFDVKFREKKDEIPPGACKPSKKQNKNNVEKVNPQKVKQNNVGKVDPQQTCKKTMSSKWVHIFLYTFIYLHIPPYTFIHLQIALYTFIYPTCIKILNTRKMRANIKHENDHNSGPRASPRVRIWLK